MKPLFATLRSAMAVLLLAAIAPAAFAQTISQPLDDTSASAANTIGQSFTATVTGFVTAIDVRSHDTTSATLYLYNGSVGSGVIGSGGAPSYTQVGALLTGVSSGGAFSHVVLTVPFLVVSGNTYSFLLDNAALWVSTANPYPGGTLIGNFAAVTPSEDAAFQIYETVQVADLSITNTDGVATATPGGSTVYTVTASNAGPDNVTGATVSDAFPFPGPPPTVTWTCVGAGGGTCSVAGSGNINDTVNLPVGGSVTYTVDTTLSAATGGAFFHTATITPPATLADPNPFNNTATDMDTLTPVTDLAITVTDGVTTAAPGGSVTYTITASNAGPSTAPPATVADTFPASLTVTWTCVGAGGGGCAPSGSGNINSLVILPAGASVTFTASATISASATGTLSNTATIAPVAGFTDPTPGNNSATDTDTLSAQADLALTVTDGVTTATPGGSVTYTITASNAGPSNAAGATVADTFPAALTATWTCVGAGGGTCTASGAGNINDTVNLPSGGSVTYTASATISALATGTLSNTATVTAPAGVADPIPGNNSATDTDTLSANADLAITVTDGVTTAVPGGSVTYTITASNAGPSSATAASVADTFPASLTATWTCVGAGGGTCTASGAGNINDTVNLPSGGSVTYTASATINAAATGTLSNTATVTAPAGVTDPNGANNSATDNDTLTLVTFSGPSATGTGTITANLSGPSGCSFVAPQFIGSPPGSPPVPPTAPPGNAVFPEGLFAFSVAGCGVGATITLSITYPQPLPSGARYWKYGPTASDHAPHWYVLPATITGNTATFSITDGGLGDDDFTANGTIADPGGPGVSSTAVPALDIRGLVLLMLLMIAGAAWAMHLGRTGR